MDGLANSSDLVKIIHLLSNGQKFVAFKVARFAVVALKEKTRFITTNTVASKFARMYCAISLNMECLHVPCFFCLAWVHPPQPLAPLYLILDFICIH